MSEEFFILTKKDLETLRNLAFMEGYSQGPWDNPETKKVEEAFKASMSRKVPEWATHFAKIKTIYTAHGEQNLIEELERLENEQK